LEETKYTYCRICEPNCGLKVQVIDGKPVKVTGDREHPISRGYICTRGLATVEIHNDPDRLRYPSKKVGGKWERVGWDEALSDIGGRIRAIRERYGPDAIGVYVGNPVAFDFMLSLYVPFALKTLGSKNIYSSGSQDCNNKFAACERVFGNPLLQPIPDVDKMDFLVIFGSNPAVSHMSFISLPRPIERLKGITDRGGRVIVIDPRRTETVREVGEHIFIRPDTDIYLLLSMIHIIISEGLYDKDIVVNHTKGLMELEKLASRYTPERVKGVTGIPAAVIESLARDFAAAKNAGIYGSLGINLGSFGTLAYWLIQCLNTITGRLDRRGGMIFCDGLVDFPRLFNLIKPKGPAPLSRIGNYPSVLESFPAGVMADEILTPGEGQIKALIVLSGNPLLSTPDQEKLEKALNSLDLLVSLDLYINETGAIGDYVLPCKDFFERWDFTWTGMFFSPTRFVNYSGPIVAPEGETEDCWLVLHEILRRSGYKMLGNKAFSAIAGLLDRTAKFFGAKRPLSFNPKLLLKLILAIGGVSLRKLQRNPHGLLLDDHRTGQFFNKRIGARDKLVDLAPGEFIAESREIEEFFRAEENYGGFKLIGQRQRRRHNTWLGNVESLASKEKTNRIVINPTDASLLEIEDDDLVEVESVFGRLTITAIVSDEMMRRVVAIPHGWGHDRASALSVAQKYPGVNVNRLIASGPGRLEKFAGMAKMTGVRVSIKKA